MQPPEGGGTCAHTRMNIIMAVIFVVDCTVSRSTPGRRRPANGHHDRAHRPIEAASVGAAAP